MATKKDLFGILYLISKAPDVFEYRKRLQKFGVIAKYCKGIEYPFSFDFVRGQYGPYSFELGEAVSQLVSDGVLIEKRVGIAGYGYQLSKLGEQLLNELKEEMRDEDKRKIDNLWETYKNYTTESLVNYSKEVYGW